MSFQAEPPSLSTQACEEYLRNRVRSEFLANAGGALMSLLGATVVFGLIAWFSAAGAFLYAKKVEHAWLWIALGVTAFSFIAHAFRDPDHLSILEVKTVDGRAAYHIRLPGGWSLSNVDYTNPKTLLSIA